MFSAFKVLEPFSTSFSSTSGGGGGGQPSAFTAVRLPGREIEMYMVLGRRSDSISQTSLNSICEDSAYQKL